MLQRGAHLTARTRRGLTLLSVAALAVTIHQAAHCQESSGAAIVTITGQRMELETGSIRDGVVYAGDQTIRLDDVMLVETGRAVITSPAAKELVLSFGGTLPVTDVRFSSEAFQVTTRWGTARVAPDAVAGVVLDQSDRTRIDTALASRSGDADTVVVSTEQGQQSVSGLLESIDGERLMLNFQGQSRPISLSRVVGIATANLQPRFPSGTRCVVRLVDGGSVHGVLAGLEKGTLAVGVPNSTLELPWSQVASLSISSSHVAWLSELQPESAEHVPVATLPFEFRRDASAEGNPLTLAWPSTGETRVFPRGIGTRSASRLEFANADNWQRLVATVGIDAETGGRGTCLVSVWGDGIELWSAEIAGSTDPVPLDIPIDGINRITLVVRPGAMLDLGDHVDWAEARFVRTGGGNDTAQ